MNVCIYMQLKRVYEFQQLNEPSVYEIVSTLFHKIDKIGLVLTCRKLQIQRI